MSGKNGLLLEKPSNSGVETLEASLCQKEKKKVEWKGPPLLGSCWASGSGRF